MQTKLCLENETTTTTKLGFSHHPEASSSDPCRVKLLLQWVEGRSAQCACCGPICRRDSICTVQSSPYVPQTPRCVLHMGGHTQDGVLPSWATAQTTLGSGDKLCKSLPGMWAFVVGAWQAGEAPALGPLPSLASSPRELVLASTFRYVAGTGQTLPVAAGARGAAELALQILVGPCCTWHTLAGLAAEVAARPAGHCRGKADSDGTRGREAADST